MYSLIASDGVTYGPVDLDQLMNWAQQGRVDQNSLVIDHTLATTLPASQIPGLQGIFATSSGNYPTPPASGGYGNPHNTPYNPQAYGYAPVPNYRQTPPRQKVLAAVFAFFLGSLGIHQFYLGKTGLGITMLLITVLTCGYGACITGVWALIDFILILAGSTTDAQGRALI